VARSYKSVLPIEALTGLVNVEYFTRHSILLEIPYLFTVIDQGIQRILRDLSAKYRLKGTHARDFIVHFSLFLASFNKRQG
jgi:hypothetical protein